MAKIVAALGGNAILRPGQKGTYQEQLANVAVTAKSVVKLLKAGHRVVLTHGNGPQIGNILLQQEAGKDQVPIQPLDICGAQTQGQIGYMLQQCLGNELQKIMLPQPVVALITRVQVDPKDPAFHQPTKPIGPFFSQEYARQRMEIGEKWIEDSGRGWRRVVPSPIPQKILELPTIEALIKLGALVIAGGGGGIPVKECQGIYQGVEAVIDKDLLAYRMACDLKADILTILTDVKQVAIKFGTPNQVNLARLTVSQAENYLAAGEFGQGSMGPKVQACINFIKQGGQKAIITSLDNAAQSIAGEGGTVIVA